MRRERSPGFRPGGEKGKLHRELGIPEGDTIPRERLRAAEHSRNREIRDDAIRADTMEHWAKRGRGGHDSR